MLHSILSIYKVNTLVNGVTCNKHVPGQDPDSAEVDEKTKQLNTCLLHKFILP